MSWSSAARAFTLAVLGPLLAGCGGGGGGSTPSQGGGDKGGGTTTATTTTAVATTTTSAVAATTTTTKTRQPGPTPCSDVHVRGHCTACEWVGSNDGYEKCTNCKAPYRVDDTVSTNKDPNCIVDCIGFAPKEKPAFPDNAQSHNGIEWPSVCIPEATSHFFTIGDWGGTCGWNGKPCVDGQIPTDFMTCSFGTKGEKGKPCPMPNRKNGIYMDFEGGIQWMVSQRMADRYAELKKANTPPRFVINVGDNFYPGGIDLHCGRQDMAGQGTQFKQVWRQMYPSPLTDIEWWGVLGNHDYGGVCFLKGWDQQIFHTWHDEKWVMPGQFWRRTVQYLTFAAEFFFVDGNLYDAQFGSTEHNMCNIKSNPGDKCEAKAGGFYPPADGMPDDSCGGTGPKALGDCKNWFMDLWAKNYKWLQEVVPASTADWQIMVNHYPAQYNLGDAAKGSWMEWKKYLEPMGIDLYIAGHTHEQKIYVGQTGTYDMGKTAWVVTGGGGGISSEAIPSADGNDDTYGFMDFEISLHELKIKAYTHGGVEGKLIKRAEAVSQPVPRRSLKDLLSLSLIRADQVTDEEESTYVF